jgi:hypothetical protein
MGGPILTPFEWEKLLFFLHLYKSPKNRILDGMECIEYPRRRILSIR